MNIEFTESWFPIIPLPQGEITFGETPQSTNLGSCLSLILYSKEKGLGGLSHIVGYGERGRFKYIDEVLKEFNYLCDVNHITDQQYFLIGGSDNTPHVYENCIDTLDREGINITEQDVLGKYHRRVSLFPQEEKLFVYRTSSLIS